MLHKHECAYSAFVKYTPVNGFTVRKLKPQQRIHQVIGQPERGLERNVVYNNSTARRVAQQPVTVLPVVEKEWRPGGLVDKIDFVRAGLLVGNQADPVLLKKQKV